MNDLLYVQQQLQGRASKSAVQVRLPKRLRELRWSGGLQLFGYSLTHPEHEHDTPTKTKTMDSAWLGVDSAQQLARART